MSSHYDTVSGYLAAQLGAIDDIGNVLTDDPMIVTEEDTETYCKYTLAVAPDVGEKVYRFWFIDCEALDPELQTARQTFFTEEWAMYGYFAYIDDPEGVKTFADKSKFQELFREVLKKLFTSLGLHGSYLGEQLFVTVDVNPTSRIDRVLFSTLFCWRVTIRFRGTYDESFT